MEVLHLFSYSNNWFIITFLVIPLISRHLNGSDMSSSSFWLRVALGSAVVAVLGFAVYRAAVRLKWPSTSAQTLHSSWPNLETLPPCIIILSLTSSFGHLSSEATGCWCYSSGCCAQMIFIFCLKLLNQTKLRIALSLLEVCKNLHSALSVTGTVWRWRSYDIWLLMMRYTQFK